MKLVMILSLLAYFSILLVIGKLTSRQSGNDTFFAGRKQSAWYMVAFGMVGASISGVTFVSVPGMVNSIGMTYLQTCMGFIVGYVAVAFILLPVYYKLNLTTIYTYLHKRLGRQSYLTGAWFFLLSKTASAAVRFYVVCMILQTFVFDDWGIPFTITIIMMVGLIWLYTRKAGIKTLVWTDVLQTCVMLTTLLLIIYAVMNRLDMNVGQAISAIMNDERSRIFVWNDWMSTQNFWKQFVSGIFIVIVMTGLDQDMMQKNLTCKSLRDAQKDMCTYGLAFLPANLLFLSLGVLLSLWAETSGIALPSGGDELLPMFAATGRLGEIVVVFFTIGIVAASFSSADSAMTALTTSLCVDIMGRPHDEKLRKQAHIIIALTMIIFILMLKTLHSNSAIETIYTLVSYTYGPLLGLFAFGLLTKRKANDRVVPYIAVTSPLLCYLIDSVTQHCFGYKLGYELLLLNGLITVIGLYFSSNRLSLNHKLHK